MKAFNTIVKILAALAAVAGAVYVVATYGDKIVAWAKQLWKKLPHPEGTVEIYADADVDAVSEEAPEAPEAPAEEVASEDAPEIVEHEPVADEADFAE